MITIKNAQSELKSNHDNKELLKKVHGLGVDIDGTIKQFLELRLYMSRSAKASTVYADLWVHCDGVYSSSNGQAGGYGYCKQSAASNEALSAIFEGFSDASGRGMNCIDEIIKQIGVEVFGLKNVIAIG